MYWIIFSVITLFIILFLGAFVLSIKEEEDSAGGYFLATCAFSLIMWMFIENKTHTTGKPTYINSKVVSVMSDKEVAIIRYNGFQENYATKKDYDAIISSNFMLEETIEYNIQGEENGKTYKLITI